MLKNNIRIAVFPLEAVIPFVFTGAKRRELKLQGYKYTNIEWINMSRKQYPAMVSGKKQNIVVAMGSHRYQLFAFKGTDCVKCGIKGRFFALERGKSDNSLKFHFNLYGIDKRGHELIITKDHIIPRSKGGKNILDNYQPLCYNCNQLKANRIENVEN